MNRIFKMARNEKLRRVTDGEKTVTIAIYGKAIDMLEAEVMLEIDES